jgi:glycosyltransferase involved in cell wall biosynthesis
LQRGLPVVASRVHGIVDYISDGVDGYLCDPYNEHEFASAIKELSSEDIRSSMKKIVENMQKNLIKNFHIKKCERFIMKF